jgi:hypothetical protein
MEPIVNKIASSGLITIDLEEMLNHPDGVEVLDMKDYLFQGLILKEKDFRLQLREMNWDNFKNKAVAIINSEDAIIPTWAFMLMSTYLHENCLFHDHCKENEVVERYYLHQLDQLELDDYKDARIVLKGCGKLDIPNSIYIRMTHQLLPLVKSLMFGEPCSTVPVYKKKK